MAQSEVRPTRKEATYTPSVEFQYLTSNPLEEFSGEYVAVVGEEVVAHGPTATDVYAKAQATKPGCKPLLAKIPRPEQAFISVYAT